jgi:hypothetical protein
MAGFEGLRLFPYYLNIRRLAVLAAASFQSESENSLAENSGERVRAMKDVSLEAERLLQSGRFSNLAELVASKDVEGVRVLGFIWGIFTFSGAAEAIRREREGKSPKKARLKGTIPMAAAEYDMAGEMHNDHFYSESSISVLKGKKRMLVAGHFEFHQHKVQVFPYIIGEEVEGADSFPTTLSSAIRVYPQQIDAFNRVATSSRSSAEDLRAVASMPEAAVKQAFADIIGEPYVSKDWGGERSDLVTARLTIEGEPTSAAFIFKGPSVPGPMHPGDMGKRGDQLIRAFEEPADLIVVQHCNKIENTVVRTAEALAYDPRRPRRYCIIDGADTAQILSAYGKLNGQRSKSRAKK